jgi:SNF2 family DNA or RNA helicase
VCSGELLGTLKNFSKEYEEPILAGNDRKATCYEKKSGQKIAEELRALVKPHFLRRTKSQITFSKISESIDHLRISSGLSSGGEDTDKEGGSPKAKSVHQGDRKRPTQKKKNSAALMTKKTDLVLWIPLSSTQVTLYTMFLKSDSVSKVGIFFSIFKNLGLRNFRYLFRGNGNCNLFAICYFACPSFNPTYFV